MFFLRNRIDPYYTKLIAQAQAGIIIGDSRANHGLNPEFLDFKIDNFAFNIIYSPYDKSYLNLITKKIKSTSNNTHIVSVTPWSLLKDSLNIKDLNPYFAENLKFPFINPNWEYTFGYIDLSIYKLLQLFPSNATFTTDCGWLKQEIDSSTLEKEYPDRLKKTIENYTSKYTDSVITINTERVKNLINIIRFLKKSGSVYVVRLPISKEILDLENKKFPEFNSLLNDIVFISGSNSFIDLTNMNIQTIDGVHIWINDVKKVSKELNSRISNK